MREKTECSPRPSVQPSRIVGLPHRFTTFPLDEQTANCRPSPVLGER